MTSYRRSWSTDLLLKWNVSSVNLLIGNRIFFVELSEIYEILSGLLCCIYLLLDNILALNGNRDEDDLSTLCPFDWWWDCTVNAKMLNMISYNMLCLKDLHIHFFL